MTEIIFDCPSCKQNLETDASDAGSHIQCPECKAWIIVPLLTPQDDDIKHQSFNPEADNTGLNTTAPEHRLKLKDMPWAVESSLNGRRCPSCDSELKPDAALCTLCGMDMQTGRIVQTHVPKSHVEMTEEMTLWNPTIAGCLCLLFSGAFGAWIHAANWCALGQDNKAAANRIWFWVFLISSLIIPLVPVGPGLESLPRIVGLVLLIVWYFTLGKSQQVYVKTHLACTYRKKSWKKPIGIAMLCYIPYVSLIVAMTYINGYRQIEKSAVPVVTEILNGQLGSDVKCQAVRLGKKETNGIYQATAFLTDNNQIEVTVETKGDQCEVMFPAMLKYIVTCKLNAAKNSSTVQAEEARKMIMAYSRTLVKTTIANVQVENPTQDLAEIVESVLSIEGGIWPERAELFREAGDEDPTNAISLYNQGVAACSRQNYSLAIDLYSRSIEKDAGFPWSLNNLAWDLATCPDISLRNGAKAVDLAESAIEVVGIDYWGFVGTLAAAHAQKGDFEKAILWQQKAVDSAPPEQKDRERQHMESFRKHEAWTEQKISLAILDETVEQVEKKLGTHKSSKNDGKKNIRFYDDPKCEISHIITFIGEKADSILYYRNDKQPFTPRQIWFFLKANANGQTWVEVEHKNEEMNWELSNHTVAASWKTTRKNLFVVMKVSAHAAEVETIGDSRP